MTPRFTIVADTREKNPPPLDLHNFRVERDTMPVGDYSVKGHHNWDHPGLSIERKSKVDVYGTLGGGLEAFRREMKKMRQFRVRALVIECQPDDLAWYIEERRAYLLAKYERLKAQGKNPKLQHPLSFASAIGLLDAFAVRTALSVYWCDDAYHAARQIESLCEKYARGIEKDFKRLGGQYNAKDKSTTTS